MERVNSVQMQLGRWDFAEAFRFAIADKVSIATHLLLRALLRWLL